MENEENERRRQVPIISIDMSAVSSEPSDLMPTSSSGVLANEMVNGDPLVNNLFNQAARNSLTPEERAKVQDYLARVRRNSMPTSEGSFQSMDRPYAAGRSASASYASRRMSRGSQDIKHSIVIDRSFRNSTEIPFLAPGPVDEEEWSKIRESPMNAHSEIVQLLHTPVIVLLGGFDPRQLEDEDKGYDFLRYSPAANEWESRGEMPVPRHHHSAVYLNGNIYVIGGCDSRNTRAGLILPMSTCYRYNLELNQWYMLREMNHCRMYHGVGILQDVIYAVGGKDEQDEMLDSVEYYLPDHDKWVEIEAQLTLPRMGMGVVAFQNMLWVAGGMARCENGRVAIVREIEKYDPKEDKWHLRQAKLPVPCCFMTMAVCKEKLYVIGGSIYPDQTDHPGMNSVTDVYCFDPKYDEWTTMVPLPFPRHNSAIATVGAGIYVLGGLSTQEDGPIEEVVLYDEAMSRWTVCASLVTARCAAAALTLPKL